MTKKEIEERNCTIDEHGRVIDEAGNEYRNEDGEMQFLDKEKPKTLQDMFDAKYSGICPICSKKVIAEDFRDQLSKKEFTLSGFCQECQDKTFGK